MKLSLSILPQRLAVCQLPAEAAVPPWVRGAFTSVTRTPAELSIVCDEDAVPAGVQAARGWQAFVVAGPIPFETTGVAAALTAPLAGAGISVFLLATFDTDYLLVGTAGLAGAVRALRAAGHEVVAGDSFGTVENDFL